MLQGNDLTGLGAVFHNWHSGCTSPPRLISGASSSRSAFNSIHWMEDEECSSSSSVYRIGGLFHVCLGWTTPALDVFSNLPHPMGGTHPQTERWRSFKQVGSVQTQNMIRGKGGACWSNVKFHKRQKLNSLKKWNFVTLKFSNKYILLKNDARKIFNNGFPKIAKKFSDGGKIYPFRHDLRHLFTSHRVFLRSLL